MIAKPSGEYDRCSGRKYLSQCSEEMTCVKVSRLSQSSVMALRYFGIDKSEFIYTQARNTYLTTILHGKHERRILGIKRLWIKK